MMKNILIPNTIEEVPIPIDLDWLTLEKTIVHLSFLYAFVFAEEETIVVCYFARPELSKTSQLIFLQFNAKTTHPSLLVPSAYRNMIKMFFEFGLLLAENTPISEILILHLESYEGTFVTPIFFD